MSWWHVQSVVHVTKRLIWPKLTRSTTFVSKIRSLNQIRHDILGVKSSNASWILCGSLVILLFSLKYVRWLYVPSQGHITTYRYFFAHEWKKPFKLPVDRHLEWLNAYICFKLFSYLRNFNFSRRNSQMVTFTINGTCHHETNLAWVNLFNKIFRFVSK